jgi:uncharacterized protein
LEEIRKGYPNARIRRLSQARHPALGSQSISSAKLPMTKTRIDDLSIGYRGPLSHLASEDLVSQFADNVLCTWNMTRVALESIQSASGMIVNIGSLAGLIATPNMGGYCVSKFGLTALSRQLRVELASQNIGVMLAILGPIARSDSGFRYQELAKTRGLAGSSVNAPAGGAKLRLLDPIMVSQRILTAASRRQSELVLPSKAKYLAALAPLWPSLADRILSRYISSS